MKYRHAPKRNFADFSNGRVFYALPGQPAFPVRLASEIFQRALEHWRTSGGTGRCRIYDPVCGGGYWLSVLAYLHWNVIAAIYASDVNPEVLPVAQRNLALLTPAGLDQRITQIEALLTEFGKPSHAAALQSARQFRRQLAAYLESHSIATYVFQADAADLVSIRNGLGDRQADLLLADVPYGWRSAWVAEGDDLSPPGELMLEALQPLLKPGAVVAMVTDKRQKINAAAFHRLERFQVGKRRISILQST